MRFQVPQFTDVEMKLVGPLTLRQFLWVGLGGLIVLFLNFFLEGYFFLITSVIVVGIACAMAFIKIDGVSLPVYVGMGIVYFFGPRKYKYYMNEDTNGKEQT